jgi:hypothetical protein
MKKEKQIIMTILQSHALKQTDLLSDFAREQIADEILNAQREIWTDVLSQAGITLEN